VVLYLPPIKLGRHLFRALLPAGAASGAFSVVHLPRFLQDVHFKITYKSSYVLYLSIGAQGDFRMLRHIDHFGGEYAGGAVQGGKRLVQLSHAPTNAGFALYQHYLIVGIGTS